MTMTMTRKISLWLWLLLLGTGGLSVALTAAETPPALDPPAGQLLVASRAIQDPRFYHSVILLIRHDRNGALGIVINHVLGQRPIAAVLAEADRGDRAKNRKPQGDTSGDAAIAGTIRIYLGGPVQPQFGFVIHSTDYRRPETQAVADGVAMTASRAVLRDIGHHKGPAKYLFALGYAGWGAGQLEGEMARHDWFTATANPALVFDTDPAALWQAALSRRTREL